MSDTGKLFEFGSNDNTLLESLSPICVNAQQKATAVSYLDLVALWLDFRKLATSIDPNY